MIPGLIYPYRIILLIFNNENYLKIMPHNNEYSILLQDSKIYDNSKTMYLL